MGTKVHSLFVRCAEPRRVAEAIAPLARDAELFEVVLVPAGVWTVVLGDELDDLDTVASPLSSALASPVVHTRVVDGDAAQMRLMIAGEEVGWIATPPRMFRRSSIGDVVAWRALFEDDSAVDEIENAWRDADVSMEQRVAITAHHLGIDRQLALENMHALVEDHPSRIDLAFEIEEPPHITGEPRLRFSGGSLDREELAVGERAEIFATIENDGGAGRGARLTIAGAAIAKGLVEIEALSILREGDWRRVHGAARRDVTADLDLPLGAGRWVMSVRVNVRAAAQGDGALTLTIAPTSGAEARRSIDVTSYTQGRRPLHAVDDPAALRGLWRPDAVHAWIVLDEPRDRALDVAIEALLRFHRLLDLPPDTSYRRFSAAPGSRYRQCSVSAAKLTERAIRTWMRDASSLDLSLADDSKSAGAALELISIPAERSPERAAPHIGFRLTMTDRSEDESAALERALVSLVDGIVSQAQVRQAFVDRWSGVGPFDTTAYEQACGVTGPALPAITIPRISRIASRSRN